MKRSIFAFLVLLILLAACSTSINSTPEPEPIFDPIDELTTAFTVGVFEETRGGQFNFADSSAQSALRLALQASFPNMTFLRSNSLDDVFLASVDVLLLSSANTNSQAVDALSAAEQASLIAFVQAGGGALLFVDNDAFGGRSTDAINESFLDPFGLDASGTLTQEQRVVVLPLDNPITNGGFGSVSDFDVLFPGYFEALGRPALNLAMLDDNGEAALAYLMRGALSAGSGGVTFFADSNMTVETFDENIGVLIKNALAYAAGLEP